MNPTILEEFRPGRGSPSRVPVAAIQVDLVAHSLGGLMARGMARAPQAFRSSDFFRGLFHKLITLGSTHLGSHHALRLMDGTNDCTRDLSGWTGAYNLQSLVIDGRLYNGAVFDQIGDGVGVQLSPTIRELHTSLPTLRNGLQIPPLPTAMVAATLGVNNASETVDRSGWLLRRLCSDFLAQHYSNNGWPAIFNFIPNDGIVAETSASENQPIYTLLRGVAHGPGSVGAGSPSDPHLGFNGPHLLEDGSGAPGRVIDLLNTSIASGSFVLLPQGQKENL